MPQDRKKKHPVGSGLVAGAQPKESGLRHGSPSPTPEEFGSLSPTPWRA